MNNKIWKLTLKTLKMKDVFKLELVLHVSDKAAVTCDAIWDLVKSLPPHLLHLGPSVFLIHRCILSAYTIPGTLQ